MKILNLNNKYVMTITSNGCVGHGTTTPSAKLYVISILEQRRLKLDKIREKLKHEYLVN